MPSSEGDTETHAMLLHRLQAALREFQASGNAVQLIGAAGPRKCGTLVVLDSSFNPPTIAHMTMATSAIRYIRQKQRKDDDDMVAKTASDIRLLLLLAVNNADKAPKPASFEHRLLMMRSFATDIQQAWRREQDRDGHAQQSPSSSDHDLPVDIGLTTYPYFHDKSAAIARAAEYEFTTSSPTSTQQIFLAGYDTLIRIFNPKYYSTPVPEEGPVPDNEKQTPMQLSLDPFLSRARLRVTMRTDADWGGRKDQIGYVEKILHGDELEKIGGRREWAQRVEMVDAMEDQDGLVLSSTEARKAIQSRNWDKVRKLVPENVTVLIERGEVVW